MKFINWIKNLFCRQQKELPAGDYTVLVEKFDFYPAEHGSSYYAEFSGRIEEVGDNFHHIEEVKLYE